MDQEDILTRIRAEQLRCAEQYADPGARLGLYDWFAEEFLMEEEMRKTKPPLTLEQQRALVGTRRTATLAALSLIRVGSTPQDLHERIRAAEVECGLWVDAVERLRKMEARNATD
ncbi:MAG: hypothetical protein INH43_10790 [Acidobacteriaceae bacterium]|nr:hypothetical protein [Acidobacteriaceae bacterium]